MAGDFQAIGQFAINQEIDLNSATQNMPLGMRILATDVGGDDRGQGEFIYLKGLASTAIGEVVVYNHDDWTTKLAIANDIGPIAISMAATVASEFGWYQIAGKASGLVATGFADNGDVYLTATAGTVDDTDVAGDYVANCKGASAISGGLADLEISYPSVADGKDN
jgi:hypothetical protein